MSPQISEEVLLLLVSMYGGLILIICYDAMRIFRRIMSASIYRVIVEDIIFWTIASIFMFDIFLKYNYGRPRFYAIGAALGVMLLYEKFIGRHIVNKISVLLKKILKILLKPLKKVFKMFKLKNKKLRQVIKKKVIKCPHKKSVPVTRKKNRAHATKKKRADNGAGNPIHVAKKNVIKTKIYSDRKIKCNSPETNTKQENDNRNIKCCFGILYRNGCADG